jgi:hypothetical protein
VLFQVFLLLDWWMVFLDVVGLGNKEPLDDAPGYRYVDFDCEYHTSKHPLWELLFEKLG